MSWTLDVDLQLRGGGEMPHLGTEGSFLIGGVLGLFLLMWLMRPHPTLDRINEYDITQEKLERVAGKDMGSCLYVLGLLLVGFIVIAFVVPGLFQVFTPEATDQIHNNFWRVR